MAEQRLTLPFQTEVRIPVIPEFQLTIRLCGKDSEGKLEIAQDIVQQFVSASEAGMFSGPDVHPLQSSIKIVSSTGTTHGEVTYVCDTKGIDIGAFRILLSMITQCHYLHEPLRECELKSSAQAMTFYRLSEIVNQEVPRKFSKIPFHLSIEKNLSKSRRPVVRIEFERKLEDVEFERVSNLIVVWETLVVLGGYLNTFDPMEELPLHPGELYMVTPRKLEYTISEFSGPVHAFDGMVNMAVKLHASLSPLVSLEIE